MSGSVPSTLLVQRLDSMLGLSLAKYSSLAPSTSAFETLLEPGQPAPVTPAGRRQENAADQQLRQADKSTITNAPTQPGRTQRSDAASNGYPSSPTLLGSAAQTVLDLLQRYPSSSPFPLVLRQPLLGNAAQQQQTASSGSVPSNTSNPQATAATPGSAASLPAISRSISSLFNSSQALSSLSSASLVTSSPIVAQIAQTLAQSVQTSGMFYEANLARVAFDGQAALGLREHPQARIAAEVQAAPSTAPSQSSALSQDVSNSSSTTLVSTQTTGQTTPSPQSVHLQHSENLSPEHAHLVRQQLDVLANQQWNARAEAWPGVPMTWEISKQPERNPSNPAIDPDQSQHPHETSSWQTSLTLQLPRLGTIEALLRIDANGCSMRLLTDEHSQQELQQHIPELQAQFQASSVRLLDLHISRAESGGDSYPQQANA